MKTRIAKPVAALAVAGAALVGSFAASASAAPPSYYWSSSCVGPSNEVVWDYQAGPDSGKRARQQIRQDRAVCSSINGQFTYSLQRA